MDNESIHEQLLNNNPFSSLASPLPFENTNPDIQQLNRETSDEIEQLLRQKRRAPSVPLAGLILGEAGSGKTHMLARILRRMRANASAAIFVAARAFRDPDSVAQQLLSEMFISLKSPHSNGRTQFDVMISEMMNTYNERRREDGFSSIENLDIKTYLAKDMPGLDRNFLKCLILYMTSNDETVKSNILEWLDTGLDDNDSLSLGLPLKDTYSMTDAKREALAEKTIISLGIVLAYAKVPMLVCFDQLETMKNRDIIEAWGNIVAMLMNNLPGILPLCFVRFDFWEEVFMPVLDEHVLQRVRSNTMVMKTCTIQQARQLIHDKIAYVFKEGAEEKYKWLISRMGDALTTKLSPRDVIDLANQTITSTTINTPGDIYRTISNAYNDECRKVASAQNMWPPNADNLTLALEVWLWSHDGFISSKGDGKYIRILGEYEDKKFAFAVIAKRNSSTATAGSKRVLKFVEEYPKGICFYITEAKTHKKTWNQVNTNLKSFSDSGGRVIILSNDERIKWYGLTALINRIDSGDVNLHIASQPRAAKREDIREFVRSLDLLPGIFGKKDTVRTALSTSKPEPKPAVINPDVLGVNLKGIISTSPMNILTVDKAVELLEKRRIIVNRNEILAFVKANSGVFRTFQSKNDVLITFADKK